jgi:hypothetical protein
MTGTRDCCFDHVTQRLVLAGAAARSVAVPVATEGA